MKTLFSYFSHFYLLSIYNFRVTHLDFQVCHKPKKIFKKWPHLQERCAMSWNEWKNGRFCTNNKKRIVLGGLHPPNPQFLTPPMHRGLWPRALDAFRLNLSSQLVLGYYWLAFLNRVHVSIFFCEPNFFSSRVAKFSGKLRNALSKLLVSFFVQFLVFEIWLVSWMVDIDVHMVKYIKIDHTSKTKSRTK